MKNLLALRLLSLAFGSLALVPATLSAQQGEAAIATPGDVKPGSIT